MNAWVIVSPASTQTPVVPAASSAISRSAIRTSAASPVFAARPLCARRGYIAVATIPLIAFRPVSSRTQAANTPACAGLPEPLRMNVPAARLVCP